MKSLVALVLSTSMLVACGGGGSSSLPKAPSPVQPATQHATLTVKVSIPTAASTTKLKLKHIFDVASNTNGIKVVAYATGDRTTPLATSVADIASGAGGCIAAGTSRTCTFAITTPIGDEDFVFTTYDTWTGTTVAGNVVGAGVTTQTITAGTPATVNVTLSSVLSTVNLGLVPASIHTLIPSTTTLDIYALDADGDVIVSPGFVDANGNPLSLTLGLSTNPNTSLTLSAGNVATPIAGPLPNGVQMTYNGLANAAASVAISATVSSGSITTTPATLNVVYPTFTYDNAGSNPFLGDTNLTAVGNFHGGAAYDTASNLFWFTSEGVAPSIDEYNVGVPAAITHNAGGAGVMGGLALFGGNLWVAAASGLYSVSEISPAFAAKCVAASGCPPSNGSGIGYDSTNGLLYYTSGTNLVIYNIAGDSATTFPIGVVTTGGVAVDSTVNHNVWIASGASGGQVYEYRTSTPAIIAYSMFNTPSPFDVVADTSGDVWVTDRANNDIFEFSDGSCSSGCSYVTFIGMPFGNVSPYFIVPDPSLANVYWLDTYDANTNQLGVARFDENAFTISTATYTGGPIGPPLQPGASAIGPGGFFMVLDGQQSIMQVQP